MKKTSLFITHTLVALIGITIGWATTTNKFIDHVIPEMAAYINADARYIELPYAPDGKAPYNTVMQQRYLGNLYLRNNYYKSYRQKGITQLEALAKLGYSPAANDLYDYYFFNAHDFQALNDKGIFIVTDAENLEKAYTWAIASAKLGDINNLSRLIFIYNLDRSKDVSTELNLIEKYALKSSVPAHAERLSQYYTKVGNPSKAEHWRKVAKEIEAKPNTYTTNELIAPWKGR